MKRAKNEQLTKEYQKRFLEAQPHGFFKVSEDKVECSLAVMGNLLRIIKAQDNTLDRVCWGSEGTKADKSILDKAIFPCERRSK
jgi:hypothetical protein